MASKEEREQFLSELKQRFEGLTTWVIEAWPDSEKPLSRADFDIARKALLDMADRGDIGDRNAAVPEPSEDGPQYRNVNPAPWP